MRFHFLVSAALLAAALPLQAQAQSGRACMIESPIQTLGAPPASRLGRASSRPGRGRAWNRRGES